MLISFLFFEFRGLRRFGDALHYMLAGAARSHGFRGNVGALIIRIGLWGYIYYCHHKKEPPK